MPIVARVDEVPALQVRPLADQREAQLWREYVDRYHYLRYTPLPGAQQLDEADETFTVTLSAANDATLADAQATAPIIDDDAAPAMTIADARAAEGDGEIAFLVTPDAASGRAVTVVCVSAVGVRGDAETGIGLELGGGLRFVEPARRPGSRFDLGRSVSVSVEGSLREHPGAAPEHAPELSGTVNW